MLLNLPLEEISQKENLSINSRATLEHLIDLMNMNRKGVVVVLEESKPVGIVTERDVVELLYRGISLDERVKQHCCQNLISTLGDRTVGYALNLTLENNIRRIVVVDKSNNFLGVITLQDLLRYLEEDFYRLTIKVKHILKKAGVLLTVSPGGSLKDVLKIMVDNKISSVPVIENRRPVGILSEKDILKLAGDRVPLTSEVRRYMTSPVDTATLDSLLVEVVEVMNYRNIRRLVVVDSEGVAIDMITIRDVIENLEGNYNKFLERKLQNAKEILNLLPEMLLEVTDTGREQLIIWVNDKVINKFGRNILDKPVADFITRDAWERIYYTLTRFNKLEHIKIKKDDHVYELSGFFISTFGKMEQGRFQLIMRDITEDIKLSTVDPLTDIYNRRFINGSLMNELERSRRFNRHFSIVICDLDNFKTINDSFGHLSGDIVLKSIARMFAETLRNLDIVGRYGGDEFMLILPDADNKTTSHVINRIRQRIESLEIEVLRSTKIKITASFGIASFPRDGTSLDDLLVIADERLYEAKHLGKNKIACS